MWRLALEHFYIDNSDEDQRIEKKPETFLTESPEIKSIVHGNGEELNAQAFIDPGYEYLYDCTKGKKCLVFSNSREETEYVTATLRQIADKRGEPDRFFIHHGNLSAQIREEAETRLRNNEDNIVTCATVTMELGIDICRLERVIQMDSPTSVSSFLQRLGRSGRRDNIPEMMMIFREDEPLPDTPLPQLIPWGLLRAIAIIQLYIEERFIEPVNVKKLPFSLLFHQTMSVLTASGSLAPAELAKRILSLPPFTHVSKEDFRGLLVSMIKNDYLELTEDGELLVGLKGERLTNSFKFYAVFKDSEDFTVRCGSDEIGTITTPPPVGDRFALAGRVWEVEELDISHKLIYVKSVDGKMEIAWPGDYGEIHTKIMQRIRRVLEENTIYPYLKKNAVQRLLHARAIAEKSGMLKKSIVHLGGYTWCLFPWLGTRSFRTMRRFIKEKTPSDFGLSGLEFDGCCYFTFKLESGDVRGLAEYWAEEAAGGIDLESLVAPSEAPSFDKFDGAIPPSLLRRAYTVDRLRRDELESRLSELADEFKN